MIAAAYIRVSTTDQLEYSPDSQLKVIREHAKRDGFIVPDEYVFREDDGISGKSASKRPAFRLMIATAKDGKSPPFEAIYVWKFSRFARNQEEAIMYKNLLKKRGVDVRSVSEPSSDSPFASLIERIIEWMDEYYLINLASEVRRGMVEKASRGEPTGKPPFGYRVENKRLQRSSDAETVRWVFEQYVAGMNIQTITRRLQDNGVLTPQGNLPDRRFVQYILNNPAYVGKLRYSTEGKAHYARSDFNDEHVMLIDAPHEPVISMELWDAAQQRLADRAGDAKYIRTQKPRFYALKGLIRCGDCGATLAMTSAATPALQCCRYSRGQCRVSHSIKMETAEQAVISYLESVIADDSYRFAPRTAPRSAPLRDTDKLIASEQTRLRRAKNALLDGVFSTQEYAAIKADIEDTISRLRSESEQQDAAPDPSAMRPKVMHVLDILKSPDTSAETKNAALHSIIEKIVFHKPQNTFDIFFYP